MGVGQKAASTPSAYLDGLTVRSPPATISFVLLSNILGKRIDLTISFFLFVLVGPDRR